MRRTPYSRQRAFTLIELLMVIAIIGILIGLLVPAVMYAMRSVKRSAIAIEVQTLANAIDQYKNKYGDYPPDGSNSVVFERHYRRLFPQISDGEFARLHRPASGVFADRLAKPSNGAPMGVMDPPEALVFALGGFSEDPVLPFSGSGGPFSEVPGSPGSYQYNVDRNGPLYDFKQAQLSLQTVGPATLSSDEEDLGGYGMLDAIPVYRPAYSLTMPYVYFDSRTYSYNVPSGMFFNNYTPPLALGVGAARPYRSGRENTNVALTGPNADRRLMYMNDRSFQLVSAGLDDKYGGLAFDPSLSYSPPGPTPTSPTGAASPIAGPMFYAFPTGNSIDFGPVNQSTPPTIGTFSRYYDADGTASGQLDNATNFSEGILSDGLPN